MNDIQLKQPAYTHRQQHDRRRDGVGQAVRTRGGHRRGGYFFAYSAIVREHIELDEYRREQYRRREQTDLDRLGADDLLDRAYQQLNAHDDYERRDGKAGDVLYPAVAEGVVGIGLLARETEAQQRYRRRARVRKVIERIGRNGDRARERTCGVFPRKQQRVQAYAQHAAQRAVCLAYRLARVLRRIFNENFCKQLYHAF